MQRGLEGRRIGLYVGSLANTGGTAIQQALEDAGARVHVLADDAQPDDFRGDLYAALVAVSSGESNDARATQLVREFMASDKPVAIFGEALTLLLEAGGSAGRAVAADAEQGAVLEGAGASLADGPINVDDALITAASSADVQTFANTVVRAFSERLEDRAVDEMSELSFPASDPPAITPAKVGPDAPEARG